MVFSRYRYLVLVLFAYALVRWFTYSTFFDDLGCPPPGPNNFGFDGCGSWTPWWKTLMLLAVLLALYLLSLGKMAISIRTWIGRPQ
jgi:hypothetical protein